MSVSVSSFQFPPDEIDSGEIFHLDLSDPSAAAAASLSSSSPPITAPSSSSNSNSPLIRPIRRDSIHRSRQSSLRIQTTSPLSSSSSSHDNAANPNVEESPSPTLTPSADSPPTIKHYLPIMEATEGNDMKGEKENYQNTLNLIPSTSSTDTIDNNDNNNNNKIPTLTPPPTTSTLTPPILPSPPLRLHLTDFQLLRVIGRGAYGKVFLVRKKNSGKLYAMKVIKKADAIRRNVASNLAVEREVLEIIQHPFVVNMRYAFQSPYKLYLVMEYVQGGELFTRLDMIPSHILEYKEAKFYAAQLVCALSFLHKQGVAYRDLKCENILIGADGFLILTDFGFSKTGMEKGGENETTSSFVGTLCYIAPEVIDGSGHGMASDWWQLGIVIYEMLVGNTPFRGDNRKKIQDSILNGKLKIPNSVSGDAKSLITELLRRPIHKRLGCREDGEEAVKKHPFFNGMDWKALENKKITPPYIPVIGHPLDTRNFSSKFTDEPVVDSPVEEKDHWRDEMIRRRDRDNREEEEREGRGKRENEEEEGEEDGEGNGKGMDIPNGNNEEDDTHNYSKNPNGENADGQDDDSVTDPFHGFSYTHPNPSPLCSRPNSTLFQPVSHNKMDKFHGEGEMEFALPAAASSASQLYGEGKEGKSKNSQQHNNNNNNNNKNHNGIYMNGNGNDTNTDGKSIVTPSPSLSTPKQPNPLPSSSLTSSSSSPCISTPSTTSGKSLLTALLHSKSSSKISSESTLNGMTAAAAVPSSTISSPSSDSSISPSLVKPKLNPHAKVWSPIMDQAPAVQSTPIILPPSSMIHLFPQGAPPGFPSLSTPIKQTTVNHNIHVNDSNGYIQNTTAATINTIPRITPTKAIKSLSPLPNNSQSNAHVTPQSSSSSSSVISSPSVSSTSTETSSVAVKMPPATVTPITPIKDTNNNMTSPSSVALSSVSSSSTSTTTAPAAAPYVLPKSSTWGIIAKKQISSPSAQIPTQQSVISSPFPNTHTSIEPSDGSKKTNPTPTSSTSNSSSFSSSSSPSPSLSPSFSTPSKSSRPPISLSSSLSPLPLPTSPAMPIVSLPLPSSGQKSKPTTWASLMKK